MLISNGIVVVLFVAGLVVALTASLALWSRRKGPDGSSLPRMGWFEVVFVSVIGVVVFVGWVGVILASLGVFSLTILSLVLLAVAGMALWLQRPIMELKFRCPSRYEYVLLILLLGCSIVYFRPHEYILGGSDAGSYMNIGATVARTGKFVVQDEWTRLLSDYAPVTLREQPPGWLTRQLQFVGWYIDDTNPSRVIPQFYPFHPILIAIGISLAGLYGGLLVTPLWGVLSIAAVYFLGRRLFDSSIGLLAASLLALTPTQIWFARYPTTEPLTLLLVFTGLLAFQTLWDDPSAGPIWGIFGGATLGAAFLTRIDLPVVALLVIGALAVRWRQGRWSRGWSAYAIILGLFLVHTFLSAWLINWPYFWNTYSGVLRVLSQSPLALVVGGLGGVVLVVGGIVLWRKRSGRADNWLDRVFHSRQFCWLLIASVILLSAYAYFLRPRLEPVRYATGWPAHNRFPITNGQNWVRIGWYLTPLGLLLATFGLTRILWRESLGRLGLFLSVGILTTIQYVYNIFNMPYHIYAMRRYVPIVIPMLMVYAAVAIIAVFRARRSWLARAGGALLALSLMIGLVYQARFVLPQRDMYGAVEQLTTLNSRLDPDAIIIINEPSEKLFADFFGVPLRFTFGHDIATIRRDDNSVQSFINQLMAYAADQHRPMQLVAVDPIAPVIRQSVELQPVEMVPITLRVLMSTYYDYPSVIQTDYRGIEIYNVKDRTSPSAPMSPAPIEIDIGTLDTAFIRTGFYEKEFLPDQPTTRWTSGEATVDIPLSSGASVIMELRARGFRPVGVPEADVIVWLDEREIGRFRPGETWQTFSFRAQPRPIHGISSLRFETTTFNPARLQISSDGRDLGFLVDWVKVTIAP